MRKIPKIYVYVLLLVGMIGLNSLAILCYVQSPLYTMNQYIECIQKQEYEKALSLIEQDFLTREELMEYMQDYFSKERLLTVLKKGEISKTDNEYMYEIEYLFPDRKVSTQLKLAQIEGEWKLDIPFEKQPLVVYAPLGAKVFLDAEEAIEMQEGVYQTKELLEGEYFLEIIMPTEEGLKKTHHVQVPEVQSISFGYEPCALNVEVEDGVKVTLGGVTKVSQDGSVQFKSLLAGTYALEVNDPTGNKEKLKEKIIVHTANQTKQIQELALSEKGEENAQQFMETFYKAYTEGIKEKEDAFLRKYVSQEFIEVAQRSFSEWFIKDKNVQEVKLQTEFERPKWLGDGKLKINTFEEIYLVNQEEKMRTYRIGIGWDNVLVYNRGRFEIAKRVMTESIISYQNEEGEWVQY